MDNTHKEILARIMTVYGIFPTEGELLQQLASEGSEVVLLQGENPMDTVRGLLPDRVPDLLVLDMPGEKASFFRDCKKWASDPATAHVSLLVKAPRLSPKDRAKGYEAGIREFLPEDWSPEILAPWIRNLAAQSAACRRLLQESESAIKEKNRLLTTLESIGEGVICTDEEGRVTFMNQVSQDLTGWSLKDGLGKPFLTVFHIVREDGEPLEQDPVGKVLATGETVELENNCLLVSRYGIKRPIIDNAAPIREAGGVVVGVVVVFRDVTEERGYLSEIEYLSFHDPMTGLYNRRFYMEELRRLDTSRRLPLSLIMGDVNGLKLTNDSFGHDAGDRLICSTAEILGQVFRKDDILCRYGGDEFVAILPNTDLAMAESIVRRILNRIQENQPANGILSVSFGLDCKMDADQDIAEVLRNAEDNMYKTKLVDSPSVRSATIHAVINTLFEKNTREEAHSKRVSDLATRLATALKLPYAQIDKVRTAALMHDIGKIIVPDGVLDSPDHLSEDEWEDIQKHPETGYRILNCAPEMKEISEIILQHHERWDGKGYPKGIAGREIDVCARIIAIADTYDAMTSARPYRDAMDADIALKEIQENAGVQFDPDMAREFVRMCSWDLCLNKVNRQRS